MGPDEPQTPGADELAALDAIDGDGVWEVAGRSVRLTNLDKVLFPAPAGGWGRMQVGPAGAGLTKRDMIRYYATVAPTMLGYLRGRPLNMNRFPDGVDRPGFWHKAVPDHAPDWIDRWRFEHAAPGRTRWYFVVEHPAALVWLANYGVVEFHAWTSTCTAPEEPSWALIDLDPGASTTFDELLVLARLHRSALDHLGIRAQPKVTGRRGIQIWIPVRRGYTFDETRSWVETLSRAVGAVVPDLVSWSWNTADRGGRARLDFTQNAQNKTLVSPYSLRAAPGAPASVPITWDELDDEALTPDRWRLGDVVERLHEVGDLFAHLLEPDAAQELPTL
ncbi:MAG: hypothetical protein R2698_02145 [Microthrixaceae bacterium]